MVGAMVGMALLRTPSSPLLSSPLASAALSPRVGISPANLTRFDGFLRTQSLVDGGEALKRAGRGRSRSTVCCVRASVGEDRRHDAKEPQFPPPVRRFAPFLQSSLFSAIM